MLVACILYKFNWLEIDLIVNIYILAYVFNSFEVWYMFSMICVFSLCMPLHKSRFLSSLQIYYRQFWNKSIDTRLS